MAAIAAGLVLSFAWHVVLVVVLARRANIDVQRARLFLGPKLVGFTVLGVPWELGVVPLGSYVAFSPMGEERTSYDDASRAQRVLVSVGPWLSLVLVAALFAGLDAFTAFALGFPQCFMGLFVASEGPRLVDAIMETTRTAPPLEVVGLVLSKLSAFNLLPFPGTGGGRAVEALIGRRLPIWLAFVPTAIVVGWLVSAALARGAT